MLGKPLGAKLAAIYRMRFEGTHGYRAALAHADLKTASDRAVSAGGRDPSIRDPARCGIACFGVSRIRVVRSEVIQPNQPFQIHAAIFDAEENAAAMFLGTTV